MENTIEDFIKFVQSKKDVKYPMQLDPNELRMLVAEFTNEVQRKLINRYKLDD